MQNNRYKRTANQLKTRLNPFLVLHWLCIIGIVYYAASQAIVTKNLALK